MLNYQTTWTTFSCYPTVPVRMKPKDTQQQPNMVCSSSPKKTVCSSSVNHMLYTTKTTNLVVLIAEFVNFS